MKMTRLPRGDVIWLPDLGWIQKETSHHLWWSLLYLPLRVVTILNMTSESWSMGWVIFPKANKQTEYNNSLAFGDLSPLATNILQLKHNLVLFCVCFTTVAFLICGKFSAQIFACRNRCGSGLISFISLLTVWWKWTWGLALSHHTTD